MRELPKNPPRFSLVVPFHDEQQSVRELHRQLSAIMTGRFEPVEFVYVDDQSSDATPQILAEIAEEDPRVAVLRLKRNYGQTTALAAGFDYASGDVIISMDGDLQHDPADIPTLLETLDATGCDIVSGWRQKRGDNFILRRVPFAGSELDDGQAFRGGDPRLRHDFQGLSPRDDQGCSVVRRNAPLYSGAGRMERSQDRRGSDSQYRAARRPIALRHFAHSARFFRHHHHPLPDALYDAPAALLRSSGTAGIICGWRNHGVPAGRETDVVAAGSVRAARPVVGPGNDADVVWSATFGGGAGRRTAHAHPLRIPREPHLSGGARLRRTRSHERFRLPESKNACFPASWRID